MKLAVLGGDGIGPEVTAAAVRVLRALAAARGFPLEVAHGAIGWGAHRSHGDALPKATLDLVGGADAALLGAVTTPADVAGYRSPVVRLRRELSLFACVRPVRSLGGLGRPDVDLVVVRENTEGLYGGREHEGDGWATSERRITRSASERVLRFGFRLARARGFARLTVVHKANVLRATCGLFRRAAVEVAADYRDIELEERLVDTAAMELAARPERFQVVVTTNLFGDVLSDVACIHGGGLGLARSANLGDDASVFEPVHGSAPDIAGSGRANPLAAILATASLLAHRGRKEDARAVERAVELAVTVGEVTPDLGGSLDTDGVTDAVIARLRAVIG